MGEWENGRMGEWENGRMGEWENGRMGEERGSHLPILPFPHSPLRLRGEFFALLVNCWDLRDCATLAFISRGLPCDEPNLPDRFWCFSC